MQLGGWEDGDHTSLFWACAHLWVHLNPGSKASGLLPISGVWERRRDVLCELTSVQHTYNKNELRVLCAKASLLRWSQEPQGTGRGLESRQLRKSRERDRSSGCQPAHRNDLGSLRCGSVSAPLQTDQSLRMGPLRALTGFPKVYPKLKNRGLQRLVLSGPSCWDEQTPPIFSSLTSFTPCKHSGKSVPGAELGVESSVATMRGRNGLLGMALTAGGWAPPFAPPPRVPTVHQGAFRK